MPTQVHEDDTPRRLALPASVELRGTGAVAMKWPTFVELAPDSFAKVRAAFGISARRYRATLANPHAAAGAEGSSLWPTLRTMVGAGKSGAEFFLSSDSRLIIKSTIHAC